MWKPCMLLMCSYWARSTDLGILLGMALGNQGLEVRPMTQSKECALTGVLREKLQYKNRLQYMVTTRHSLRPRPKPLGPVPALSLHGPWVCLSPPHTRWAWSLVCMYCPLSVPPAVPGALHPSY